MNSRGKRTGLHNRSTTDATNHTRLLIQPSARQIPRLDDPISLDGREQMRLVFDPFLHPISGGIGEDELEMIGRAVEFNLQTLDYSGRG